MLRVSNYMLERSSEKNQLEASTNDVAATYAHAPSRVILEGSTTTAVLQRLVQIIQIKTLVIKSIHPSA